MVSWGLLHVENLSCTCRGFLVEGFPKKPFINKRGYIRMQSKFDTHAVRNRNHLLLQFRSIPNETLLREAHLLLRPPYAAKNIVQGQGHRPTSDPEWPCENGHLRCNFRPK